MEIRASGLAERRAEADALDERRREGEENSNVGYTFRQAQL